MSNKQKITIGAVRTALSAPRMETYEVASGVSTNDDPAALALYAWNIDVSGALMAPLHVCEVVIRNAVADAIGALYGPRWPWSPVFERSLPNPQQGYSPRRDLRNARRAASTADKVIPELKFVFWQKMFTGRHDTRIWDAHLLRIMPNLDASKSVAILRRSIYDDLERVRRLRNRIAHYEPIFIRALADDYQTIRMLIMYRCPITATWLDGNQNATAVIAAKPI